MVHDHDDEFFIRVKIKKKRKEIRLNDSFIYKSVITNKLVMNGKSFFWKLYLLENTPTMVYLSVQMNVNFIYTLFTTCFQLHSL